MRRTTPVLALSTILASMLFGATQRPADAACTNASANGCNEPAHAIGPLAESERRPSLEELTAKEHELPTELWDKVRSSIPPDRMEELSNKIADIVHRYAEAGGHARDADKKIFDADEAIDRARSDRITAEGEKRAAEEERDRQLARFIAVLEDTLREFRPPSPPREPHWRPHRAFWHHFRRDCEVDPCAPWSR
jgi:hypothetical protein